RASRGRGGSTVATLHLMVGLPCSGKTTLARDLEIKRNALRLTLDDWHIYLFGPDFRDNMDEQAEAQHAVRHKAVESVMWTVAAKVLVLGVGVILDFGCWARSERDDYRLKARQLGVGFRIHYTEESEEVLLERLTVRNAQRPESTFYIPDGKLKDWIPLFDPPLRDELQ
ncbi:MAG: AAA family ATPase, partial [Clostridia bacterium]